MGAEHFARAIGYAAVEEYDKAWADIRKYQELGGEVDPEFLETLKEASGRSE